MVCTYNTAAEWHKSGCHSQALQIQWLCLYKVLTLGTQQLANPLYHGLIGSVREKAIPKISWRMSAMRTDVDFNKEYPDATLTVVFSL